MHWPRLHLNSYLWLGLVAGLLLLALYPGYRAYKAFQSPAQEARSVPIWRWEHSATWDYGVILKPNSLYNAPALGPGGTYPVALTERIDALLTYLFTSDLPVRLEGWYEVSLVVAADERVSRVLPVVGRTPFTREGKELALRLGLPFNPWVYREVLKSIEKEIGVAFANPQLVVEAKVEVRAESQAGEMKDVLAPTLSIPLRPGGVYTIGGEPEKKNSGTVNRTVVEPVPGVAFQRQASLAALAGLALAALLLLLFTAPGPWHPDPVEREALRIAQKYRRRLVEVSESTFPEGKVIPLASIDDLARLSEELLKPILHARLGNPVRHIYFIPDGAVVYQYSLGGSPP